MQATCFSIGFERTCYKTRETTSRLTYYASGVEIQATSETEAKAAMLRHAEREAKERTCSVPTNIRQLKSVRIDPNTTLTCSSVGHETYHCKADGFAICTWNDLRKLTGGDCLR
jgi:hypothetical protein